MNGKYFLKVIVTYQLCINPIFLLNFFSWKQIYKYKLSGLSYCGGKYYSVQSFKLRVI